MRPSEEVAGIGSGLYTGEGNGGASGCWRVKLYARGSWLLADAHEIRSVI